MTLTRRGLLAGGTVASLLIAGKPAAAQELGELAPLASPRPFPETPVFTADGAPRRFAAEAAGKPALVNLWATWCPPCVAELPSLASLHGSADWLRVIAISEDRAGVQHVSDFLAAHHITSLPLLLDRDSALMHALGARGLPTTYAVNASGVIVAMEEGGLDWTRPEVASQLRKLLEPATKA